MPQIPSGSTIASVKDRLTSPENYVVGVFHHAHECNRDRGSAFVRIGVQGTGKSPHYRIEYDVVDQTYPYPIYGAFDGRNHKPLIDEDQLRDENWSTARITIDELRAILKDIRDAKKVKKT